MPTHFANVDRGNESYPHDEWGETACGLEYTDSDLSNNWEFVSCKNCLKARGRWLRNKEPNVQERDATGAK